MKFKTTALIISICTILSLNAAASASESSDKLIEQVKAAYKKGEYRKALRLLKKDLDENPYDGTSHFYMGLVRQQLGQDIPALDELELAARLLPAETLDSFAEQAIEQVKEGKQELPETPKPKDWFTQISESVTQLFNGDSQKSGTAKQSQPWQMPDLMAGVDDMYRQAKRMIKSQTEKPKNRKGGYQSWAATTMSMADIQDLVRKSKVINKESWASHGDGLKSFRQAPANTPAWDYWIARFKRSFQYILMSHLAKEGEVRPYGSAACIFSLDNRGNLRGHIYASTASKRLNSCLIKTIQELNHSRILEFPKNAKITGYNFQMRWQFGKLLRYIAYVRAVKAKRLEMIEAQKAAALEAKIKAEKDAKAKLLAKKKLEEEKARQKRLALLRKKRLEAQKPEFKTKVFGEVLPNPKTKPVELKAKALTLADVPFSETIDTGEGDPFSKIDDRTIMNWPDINQ